MGTRWITFDCFGTLVDWHSGFFAIMSPLVGDRTVELLHAYHEFERLIEAEKPPRLYKDVLVTSLLRAAKQLGVPLSEDQARQLPLNWSKLPIFGDVESMLQELRSMDCRLGVLTNCDEDLFVLTQRNFKRPFDLVVTAEQIGGYKPSLGHFERFAQLTGATPADWVHVACSWFHDIVPARKLGLRRVWLDRDKTGEDPAAASARVSSAAEVCGAVQKLFPMSVE
jgi:2-haloacid dehalogenase